MRLALIIGLAALAATGLESAAHAAETRYDATAFELRNAAAVVKVIPEAREDIAASVAGGAKLPKFKAYREGGRIVLDGGLAGKIRGCRKGVIAFWKKPGSVVTISGLGEVGADALPVVTLRVPMDVDLKAGPAVSGEIGASRSARLVFTGCGEKAIEPVSGLLDLSVMGSGDVGAASAGQAKLTLDGSADIGVRGPVKDGLEARVAGSGSMGVGAVSGGVKASLTGSGDLAVGAARGPTQIDLRGSGDVAFGSINGPAKIDVRGSGDVAIGGGAIPVLEVQVMGSGGVSFGGAAGDVKASIAGSGDVVVARATGKVSKSVAGSGEVVVGGR